MQNKPDLKTKLLSQKTNPTIFEQRELTDFRPQGAGWKTAKRDVYCIGSDSWPI
jgi:hypothetical protein